ncbi:MAG: sigma-54-dependent Fis family transcriptional regulator [Gammaproteobacteria bacterium]|nr:MAG: sigma-54-dependent Fis family transcriptional regulator [Gammaproteobacteria bacterium]
MQMSEAHSQHRERVFSVITNSNSGKTVRRLISNSWKRCVNEYGLDPVESREPTFVETSFLQERQESLDTLLEIARVEMANLYQQIANTGHSVLLTDDSGMIIHYTGDPSFDSAAAKRGLQEGAIWSEKTQGTNGMGTCLAEQKPVVVHHEEHFFANNLNISCTASPIIDPNGKILGVLDASSESSRAQEHTMALVNMSAKTIENRIFLCMFKNHIIIRFHSRPEFVNTLGEGLIAFQSNGTILAANSNALFQLDFKSIDDLRAHKIEDLFDSQLYQLLHRSPNTSLRAVPIHEIKHARRFFAIVQVPESGQYFPGHSACKDVWTDPLPAPSLLTRLEFGDHYMAQNIRIAQRVLDRDIPILLKGESGTGKGVFAKAIHMSSQRADKPFVAINCASIPESLIESELFGYKAGAFTGANRQGSQGKIMQADGGTLFLDEIGDMPLSLQARLLRVLEEKEVVPLGGHTPLMVDINIISATHRNLQDMVVDGDFREDLYYRLQGVKITLPPLRERSDRYNLVKHLIGLETQVSSPVQIEEEVIDQLCSYYWPGNIRQLRNALRTMLALAETNHITAEDMIDDLFREARTTPDTTPGEPRSETETLDPLRNAERDALLQELERHRWNITAAAKRLDLSRNTLYRKMKRCGISLPR